MTNKISAIILAGGQGRRVDYRNKGLIAWRERALISHVITHIAPQVNELLISCNQDVDQYAAFGYPSFSDTLEGFQGPLAGVQAVQAHISHAYCLICPCDTPRLPGDLVARLYTSLSQSEAKVAYPRCLQQPHFLPALIQTSALASLTAYLESGERRVRGWYQQLTAIEVDFDDSADAFANINTLEQLHQL